MAVSRYNKLTEAYTAIVNDSTGSPSKEEIQASYSVCLAAFDTLSQQRETNQATFHTICDNYCVNQQRSHYPKRIRYNDLSIAASCIRKLFVYISSATANTQFDIQSISAKLNGIPTSHTYQDYREEIHMQRISDPYKQTIRKERSNLLSFQARVCYKRRMPTRRIRSLLLRRGSHIPSTT